MNLPNKLTILRIALSFVLILVLLIPGLAAKVAALAVFILASVTDLLDGRLARKWGIVSDLGVLLDPLADKILVLSAFVAFVYLQVVPPWMVVLVAGREFLITGFRLFALGRGHVLPAEAAGKHKTVSQMTAISLILLFLVFQEKLATHPDGFRWIRISETGIWWLMLLTVVLTLTSGISFFWRHRRLILSL